MINGQMSNIEITKWFTSNIIKLDKLEKTLISSEGLVPQVYYDSLNIPTFGVGHNLKANILKQTDLAVIFKGSFDDRVLLSYKLLKNDIHTCMDGLLYANIEIDKLTGDRFNSLIEMVFHMGIGSFSGFVNMIKAIKNDDWIEAYKEGKDSIWYRRFPERAEKVLQGFK